MPAVTTKEQKAQILNRLLTLRDYSPFILVCDSLAQPATRLLAEFHRKCPADCGVVPVHLEHRPNQPRTEPKKLVDTVKAELQKQTEKPRHLITIDNLNVLENIGSLLQQLMRPGIQILGVYHTDLSTGPSYYPSGTALLDYMATSIIRMLPSEEVELALVEDPLSRFNFQGNNPSKVKMQVVHRRKSGREISGEFMLQNHEIEYLAPKKQAVQEDASMLEGLTTFNLGTSEKQRLERDKVDLPFLAAQEVGAGGAQGGAIIYEFEKDDDYDEEDPYEDPF